MPTPTYTPLATVTLASATSSVTFSSIPATYRDLILVINGTTNTATGVTATHNGDTTAANYTLVNLAASSNNTTSSGTASNSNLISMYTTRSMGIIQFLDYSATDKHKTALSRSDNAANDVYAQARRWANTNAITSIAIGAYGNTFQTGSTFALYGIVS
jgi:hypothetical protein